MILSRNFMKLHGSFSKQFSNIKLGHDPDVSSNEISKNYHVINGWLNGG